MHISTRQELKLSWASAIFIALLVVAIIHTLAFGAQPPSSPLPFSGRSTPAEVSIPI